MTTVLIDLSIILLLVLAAVIGYFRGFIKSFLGAVSLLLAIFIALSFTSILAPVLEDKFLREPIGNAVDNLLIHAPEPDEETEEASEDSGNIFTDLLGESGAKLNDFLKKKVEERSEQIRKEISASISDTVCRLVSKALAFLLIFVVSYLMLLLLRLLLGLATRIPGVKQTDRVFGLLFGIVYGYGILCILALITVRVWPLLTLWRPAAFPADALDRALLFPLLRKFNLIEMAAKAFFETK